MRFPRVFPAAAVLATAAAYFFGAGLDGWWPLVWFAPVPVLVFASGASARSAAAAAFAAWLLGGLNLVSYLAMVMPPVAVAAVLLLPAAAFALAVLAHRRAALGLPAWAAPLSFPAAWTAWEWLLAQVSPHGTVGSIAYSQAEFLPLLQAASVAGIWGVTFVVALAASGLAAALRSRAAVPLVAPLCVLALALGYGYGRLAHPVPGREITVGLAATDSTLRYFDTEDPRRALAVAADYARRIAELGARKARVVVLPEKFVGVTAADAAQVRDVLAAAARSAGVAVVAGLNDVGSRPLRNTAVVFSSSGAVIAEYDKARLLPGPEPLTPRARGREPSNTRASAGASPSARTWISRSGFAATAEFPSCWCLPGISCGMHACTRAWPWCGASKADSPWHAPRSRAASPSATTAAACSPKPPLPARTKPCWRPACGPGPGARFTRPRATGCPSAA